VLINDSLITDKLILLVTYS